LSNAMFWIPTVVLAILIVVVLVLRRVTSDLEQDLSSLEYDSLAQAKRPEVKPPPADRQYVDATSDVKPRPETEDFSDY
jgi:hypothetical protein